MRAVRLEKLEGPESLVAADIEAPAPTAEEILIDVHWAGVSFPDVLQSRGKYQLQPPLPFTPGSEVAGIIRHAPEDSPYVIGDRVAAFVRLGAFAEQVTARPQMVFPLPDGMSLEIAASLPMNMLTTHFALTRRGHLRSNESVLVHGAAGGIGSAAVHLAHCMGARVIAVVSTPEKAAAARLAGADEVVSSGSFLQETRELTSGKGVDLIVDPVGGEGFTDSLRSLAPEGRLLVVGFTAGQIPTVKVNRLLLNNISVVGVGWGAFLASEPDLPGHQWADLLRLLNLPALAMMPTSRFPLNEAAAAVAQLERRETIGKVLLQVR